jgi:hypothetical protein
MLSPDDRTLLSNALVAPDHYAFDCGVGTTYGLDLTLLLRVPLFLALASEGSEGTGDQGIELLESLERIASRLVVFAQGGHITASGSHFRLYGLLEDSVVEASTPNGSFHPKVWCLRFASPGRPTRMRMLVMSKNLTTAATWDVAVTLDATVGTQPIAANQPLADWLESLPNFCVRDGDVERGRLVYDLLRDIRCANWKLPEGATGMRFHPILPGTRWKPPSSDRKVVISPFVRADALATLAKQTEQADTLVTCESELPYLRNRNHGFSKVMVLHDAAEDATDDATAEDAFDRLRNGLHAKVYLWESGDDFHIAAGSANATNAALLNAVNNEFLVELWGPRGPFGSIDTVLGSDGLGSMLLRVDPNEVEELEPETDADVSLGRARRALSTLPIELVCTPNDSTWTLTLVPRGPLELDGVASFTAWPITTSEAAYAVDATPLADGRTVTLKALPLASVTRFVAFRLTNEAGTVRCVVNLPCESLPAGRNGAIVTSVVKDRGAFMRYVRLLLNDPDDPQSFLEELQKREASGGAGSSGFNGFESPILEDLVRAYSRHPERLELIGRRIDRIRKSPDADDIIPEEFLTTWEVFERALEEDRNE